MSLDESEKVSVLTERIDNLMRQLEKFESAANKRFVERSEFQPVKAIVYGGVGAVLLIILGAVASLVILK